MIGIGGDAGRDPGRLRHALRDADERAVIVHAAGSVAIGPPLEAAYLDSTRSLFEAVAAVRPRATIVTLGSVAEVLPLDSPYARIKRRQAAIAAQHAEALGVRWRHLRLHNLVGPGTPPTLAPAAIAIRLRRVIVEDRGCLAVSHGEAVRDWLDVRDAARMVLALADRVDRLDAGEAIEVCSGVGRSVRSVAETLVAISGASVEIAEEVEPSGSDRSGEARVVVGDPRGLRGWLGAVARPRIAFERSLRDLWEAIGEVGQEPVS